MKKGKGRQSIKKIGALVQANNSKGKRRRVPRLNSKFWTDKLEEENRHASGNDTFSGQILMYRFKQGWGLITPDDVDALPKKVKAKLDQKAKELKAAGKEVNEKNKSALYFRKPDVKHEEGFKL